MHRTVALVVCTALPDTQSADPKTNTHRDMAQNESPEQETQHEKQREATKDVHVDPSDAESGIEQETQNVKKRAATQPDDQDPDEEKST